MPNDTPWSGLEAGKIDTRRVDASARWNWFWAVMPRNDVALLLQLSELPKPPPDLPKLRNLEIRFQTLPGGPILYIKLKDSAQLELFETLCRDVIAAGELAETEAEALERAVGRTFRWHYLLRGGRLQVLSEDAQKGLIGEIEVLTLLIGILGANGQGALPYAKPEDVFTPFFTGLEINDGAFQQYTCWGTPAAPGHLEDSPCVWVSLWVQLDSAAKVAAYRDFIANYAQQQKALGRFQQTDTRMLDLMQWLDHEQVVPSDVKLQMWLAFAFLAICLFNTVGLLLAKFLRRAGEIGVRRALGASRRSVFAQCLTEAGLIGFVGGVGGWLLTLTGLWLVRRQQTPYADLVHMNMAMFGTTFALAVIVSLLAGALPALRASRIAPALQLKTL